MTNYAIEQYTMNLRTVYFTHSVLRLYHNNNLVEYPLFRILMQVQHFRYNHAIQLIETVRLNFNHISNNSNGQCPYRCLIRETIRRDL